MRIAISGKIASGKTSAANHLRDNYGYTVMSFATPMKELEKIHATVPWNKWPKHRAIMDIAKKIATVCDADAEQVRTLILACFYDNEPTPGVKNRKLLQELGTDYIRNNIDKDAWVLYLLHESKDISNIVVDDMRFANEFELLKDAGFITMRLHLPEDIRMQRVADLYGYYDTTAFTHPSETELDSSLADFDYIIPAQLPLQAMCRVIDIIHAHEEITEYWRCES